MNTPALESAARPRVDFDQHSSEHAADWVSRYQDIRRQSPVAWSDHHGGFWLVSGYEEACQVLRDPATFTSGRFLDEVGRLAGGISIPPLPFRLVPTETDMPEWEATRHILNRALSPAKVKAFRDKTRAYTAALIDRHIETGAIDLVLDLANPLPALMTMELLGLPLDEWQRFADPFHSFPSNPAGSPERDKAAEEMGWVFEQIEALVEKRRKDPIDDLTTAIVFAERPEGPYPHAEVVDILLNVIGGGVDTTTALTSNALWHLHRHHDDRRRLIEDPSLLSAAAEEFLRFYTPIQNQARTASRRCVLGGQTIEAGDRVLVALASANRDEREFEDAGIFRADRFPNRHAAFGLGMHRCVGSHLARQMFEEMIMAVLARMPDYAVQELEAERYRGIAAINGWVRMPARFTPGERIADEVRLAG